MFWCPNKFKDYHPVCKAFFERKLSKALARDILAELCKQIDAYDLEMPMYERDLCLRAELLDCLSYVTANM